jgi:3'-phosphoadenosine 5'-phosphosulfate sulfotransferase (PAPS reductase)/FAD synthetase
MDQYAKKENRGAIMGTKAVDSIRRQASYMMHGCNNLDAKIPRSTPLAFWTDDDVNNYIAMFNLDISPIYAMGYEHTGCIYCAFGCGREKYPNRFQRLQMTHPKLWDHCINKLGWGPVLDYCNVPYLPRHEQIELNMEV